MTDAATTVTRYPRNGDRVGRSPAPRDTFHKHLHR